MSDTVTPRDLEDAVTWIRSRWGYEKAWDGWDSLHADFANYTVGALKEALHTWYRRGTGRAPKPDQLNQLVSEIQASRIQRGVDDLERTCNGDHTWADPSPTHATFDDGWVQTCVLCGETRPAPPCQHPAVNKRTRCCVYCLAVGVDPVSQAETVQHAGELI